MTTMYRVTPMLLFMLPVLLWGLLAMRPAPVADAEAPVCTRQDFRLTSVRFVYGSVNEDAPNPVLNYPGFPSVPAWYFTNPEAYARPGAKLVVTWRLKPEMANTEIGNTLLQNAAASDPWNVRIKFHPNISFNGGVTVSGSTITKEIPLDGLYEPAYSLDFRVVYQDSPTCMSTQDASQQVIAFYNPDYPPPSGRDRRNPRRGRDGNSTLRWTTQITAQTLGQDADYLTGKTLSDIVNSRTSGRPDGMLCNNCHFQNAGIGYKPPVMQSGQRGASQEITPSLVIPRNRRINYSWNGSGSGGIVSFFENTLINGQSKPALLEAAFNKWLSDGAQE